MKNLRLTLGAAAIALGTFTAFSFAPTSKVVNDASAQFYTNPDGSPTNTQVDPLHPCQNFSLPVCSGTFDIDETTGEPIPESGRDFLNGPRL